MKRIFLFVLDSFGIGQMPDAEKFGDVNVNTLAACAASKECRILNMIKAGLGCIDGVTCLPAPEGVPGGAYARLRCRAAPARTKLGKNSPCIFIGWMVRLKKFERVVKL